MSNRSKTGSSRRKGDEYQDLTALQLALEHYIDNLDFKLFIEYEKVGALDDIVIVLPNRVDCYQVKHAVDQHAVYRFDDLLDENSKVFFGKFSKSWEKIRERFDDLQIALHLSSNRGLDAFLGDVVVNDGFFDDKFRENRYYKDKRRARKSRFETTGLSEDKFQELLGCFQFDLKRPSWKQLEQHIQAVLLDHKLGISDRRVFAALKQLVERHAIETFDPITPQIIDTFFRETQTRYMLPQVFPVDKERFVDPPSFDELLNTQLESADGAYIVVTGPPGSGKSTSLSEYLAQLEKGKSDEFAVVRYYCFIQVHDNRQRQRLEAKSLRVNLLSELQQKFLDVLDDRRFDFGEQRFTDALESIAAHNQEGGRKLIVLVDGLDHVERDRELRDSVIEALPRDLPAGVIFIIGTQELHHWTPLALQQGRNSHHVAMPLFSREETQKYLNDRCGLELSAESVSEIFAKSGGLPLYLRYVAELAADSKDRDGIAHSLPGTVDGQIQSYYSMLWNAFDAEGRGKAKHLSCVLCKLWFSIHEGELFSFQQGTLDRPEFEEAYRQVRHLLRVRDGLVTIFHNSFRVFVMDKIDGETSRGISSSILARLKEEEFRTTRWYKYACQYALDANDYSYVIEKVDRRLVDEALLQCCYEDDIMQAIDCAIEAAAATKDLAALSRLGSLKYRTNERLEFGFPWSDIATVLLYQDRVELVVASVYSEETQTLIANPEYTLLIIDGLLNIGKEELAGKLFDTLLEDFTGHEIESKQGIITFARCAGVFSVQASRLIRWLANTELRCDTFELEELAPGYAPHLAVYLDHVVAGDKDRPWELLRNVQEPYDNQLMRHLIIRGIARHKPKSQLRTEIESYIEAYPDSENLEISYMAAKAGIAVETVNKLAGRFQLPAEQAPENALRMELANLFHQFAHWAAVLGYEQNQAIQRQLHSLIGDSEAIWSCAHAYLLEVGQLVGSHFADREIEWLSAAQNALRKLKRARDVSGERTPDLLDACRDILPTTLTWISKVLVERCPGEVDDWAQSLLELRESIFWRLHYGIGERMADYSFEFPIWENHANLPTMRSRLKPLLVECGKTYSQAQSLKGGSRGVHFLRLAALAARCGYITDAKDWKKCGVATTLAYGYRKDTTLSCLMDIVSILDEHEPEQTLASCAAILEMVKWMPEATDGRMTQEFPQELFPLVLKNNSSAALALLRKYYFHFARWQADASLEIYLLQQDEAPFEYYWALTALLDPNRSLKVRKHIAERAQQSASTNASQQRAQRLVDYTKSMTNSRHWPDQLWEEAIAQHQRLPKEYRDRPTNLEELEPKSYKLDGESVTTEEVIAQCCTSFSDLTTTLQKLKDQNKHISDHRFIDKSLPGHIANATRGEELASIQQFCLEAERYREGRYLEMVGKKYLELGEVQKGTECLKTAIHEGSFQGSLETLAEYDRAGTRNYLASEMQDRLQTTYSGFNAPKEIAIACNVFGDIDELKQVFTDYLIHCKELFAQLPQEKWFDELKDWGKHTIEETSGILQLLFDRLDAPPVEYGVRLMSAIADLCLTHGNEVLPTLIARIRNAKDLQFWRLLTILSRLAETRPDLITMHSEALLELLEHKTFLVRMQASQLLVLAFNDSKMPSQLQDAVNRVKREYSSTIAYRGFKILHVTPSSEFVTLTKKAAQLPFRRQLKAACQILDIDLDAVTAYLERKLLETGASLEDENDIARDMWSAYSHAQG